MTSLVIRQEWGSSLKHFNDPKLGSKSLGVFSETYRNCYRVTARTFQSKLSWDEDSTNGERFSLFSKVVTFYLLHFSSFGDYSVYQLQGSFEHWRDRKENRTLLSNSKTEVWTDFTIERFLSKWFALLLETQNRSASQDNGPTPCYLSGSSRGLTSSSFPSSGV